MDLPTPHQGLEKDPPGFHDAQHHLLRVQTAPSHFPGGLSALPEVFGSQGKSDSGLTFITAGDRDGSVFPLAVSSLSFFCLYMPNL